MLFCARQFEFRFPRPALVMGIVNVTPDSFSDGGRFYEADKAVDHALELVAQGAEILDIGGESTRPGAEPVSEAEEFRRVIPVIQQLAMKTKAAISVDTTKPAVARAAIDAGASIINDVTGANSTSHAMWNLVAETGAGYIIMHAQGTPKTMQANPVYEDVIRDVGDFFHERLEILLNDAGISPEQVALDPGIGFGKTLEHNLQLIAGLRSFTRVHRPLVMGASRKSFINKLLGSDVENRLPASLACATIAAIAGANILRVHDVAETVQAVRMTEAIMANPQAKTLPCLVCGRRDL